jgi:hypothetical protein
VRLASPLAEKASPSLCKEPARGEDADHDKAAAEEEERQPEVNDDCLIYQSIGVRYKEMAISG